MTDPEKSSEKDTAGLFPFLFKVFDRIVMVRAFFKEAEESLRNHMEAFVRRVGYLLVLYLCLLVGLVFFLVGLFDLLMEWTKLSPGVVYSLGGLGISVCSVILLEVAKTKKTK